MFNPKLKGSPTPVKKKIRGGLSLFSGIRQWFRDNPSKLPAAITVVAVVALLLVLQIVSAVRITLLENRLSEARGIAGVVDETRDKVDFLEQNVYYLGKTANDIRGVLNLSPLEFSFFKARDEKLAADAAEADKNSDELPDPMELAAYDALELLASHNREIKGRSVFYEARQLKEFKSFLSGAGLAESRSGSLSLEYGKEDFRFFTLSYDPVEELFVVTDRSGDKSTFKKLDASLVSELKTLSAEADGVMAGIKARADKIGALSKNSAVTKALSAKWIQLKSSDWNGTPVELAFEKKDGTPLFNAGYDTGKSVYYLAIGDRRAEYDDYGPFEGDFLAAVADIDDRPAYRISVSESKAFIERMFADPAFVAMLKKNGLKPVANPRHPDSDFTYYDLIDENGKRAGSYAVESTSGRIYIMDSEEQPLRALTTLRPESMIPGDSSYVTDEEISTISDLYTSTDSVNILLVGKHENNTDTMIVVHADKKTKKAVMFSLPRDLWIGGRRINSYYGIFGRDRLVKEISSITGLKIDYFMVVEMFAFIEIVDILGGIDVTLTEDLIDPYYKYKDSDGREVTLHYPRGTHHLNGRESLRVARSRYSSSDYSRSRRQQLIIMGLKDKVNALSLKDMGTTLNLIRTVLGYLETNMSPAVILMLLKDYGQCDVTGQNSIDTSNVLYSSYSNLYLLSPEEQKTVLEDENYDKGAWICLPRNNDWNLIRWYVRKLMD
jgi:LCP family protein required for cell wall assembly